MEVAAVVWGQVADMGRVRRSMQTVTDRRGNAMWQWQAIMARLMLSSVRRNK